MSPPVTWEVDEGKILVNAIISSQRPAQGLTLRSHSLGVCEMNDFCSDLRWELHVSTGPREKLFFGLDLPRR